MNAGEVRFLIGPNGAGKTTLLDAICGRVQPSRGRVMWRGANLSRLQEHQIARRGIGRKFQAPSVFSSLCVRDNLELAAHGPRGVMHALRSSRPMQADSLDEALVTAGLQDRADETAGALSHGAKQWLEIAMLLMQKPDLILLDEPAAGMSDPETERMGQLLHTLSASRSVLVVEHDMEFVRQFAHRVSVMHEGRMLCEGTMDEVQQNERVAEVYLGRKVAA